MLLAPGLTMSFTSEPLCRQISRLASEIATRFLIGWRSASGTLQHLRGESVEEVERLFRAETYVEYSPDEDYQREVERSILGRPRVVMDRSRLAKLRDQGLSLQEIAAKTGKSTMTVQRALKALG